MSRVFVDTSAFLALLVSSDRTHASANQPFTHLRARGAPLFTTSYVLVETYALLGRRFGMEAIRSFRGQFAPLVEVAWVDQETHERGLDLLLDRGLEDLSLVDATSFVVARAQGVEEVFAFDPHFEREGFRLLP